MTKVALARRTDTHTIAGGCGRNEVKYGGASSLCLLCLRNSHQATLARPLALTLIAMTFLRMDILLSMVLLSTGHLHGVAAWPRSSRGMQPFDKRQSIELSRDSTCNDLKTYQDQEDLPGDRINKEMYEQLKAARVLDEYFFEDDDGVFTNYVVGFATPYVQSPFFTTAWGSHELCIST